MKLFLGGKPLLSSLSPGSNNNNNNNKFADDDNDDGTNSISGRARKVSAGDLPVYSNNANNNNNNASTAVGASTITSNHRRYNTLHRMASHLNKESMRDLHTNFSASGELLGLRIHVKIPYTQVGATRAGKIFTQYVIQMELPPPQGSAPNTPSKEWTVRRRYSQFVDLDKQLRQAVPKRDIGKIASLPPKRYLNSFEDAVIIERKKGLAEYVQSALKAVANNDEAASILAVFLEMPGSKPFREKEDFEQERASSSAAGPVNGFSSLLLKSTSGAASSAAPKESTAQFVTTADGMAAHSGFLYKRGGLYQQKPFKMSFCVLNFDEAVFRFYRTSRPQLLGAIQLKGQKHGYVKALGEGEMGIPENCFGFTLFTPERELIMYAETKEDRDSWISALKRCLPTINGHAVGGAAMHTTTAARQEEKRDSEDSKKEEEEEDEIDAAEAADIVPQTLGDRASSRTAGYPSSTTRPSSGTLKASSAATTSATTSPKKKRNAATTPMEQAQRELAYIKDIREDWAIDWNDLEILEKIGGGAFGTVFKGRCWGSIVAVKQLKTSGGVTPELKLIMQKEVGVLSRLRHPNVVLYLGASFTETNAAMVTEWCCKKSLYDLLVSVDRTEPPLDCTLMLRISKQIAEGMCYLHSRKEQIIHRDLKSLNILISEGYIAKVADFGLTVMREATANASSATYPNNHRSARHDSHRSQPTESIFSNSGADFFGTEGTAQWMAPEVMEGARYNFKVDVYSYGILLTELLTRKMPFKDLYAGFDFVDAVVDRAERPTIPTWASMGGAAIEVDEHVHDETEPNSQHAASSSGTAELPGAPSELGDLVIRCTNRDPNQRPEFKQVITILDTLIDTNSVLEVFTKFDLPRLRENLDVGDVDDVVRSALELSSILKQVAYSLGDQLCLEKKLVIQRFLGPSNLVLSLLSRLAIGNASRVIEKGGDYIQEPIPLDAMIDMVICVRLLISSISIDPASLFQHLHMPKRDPLEAIVSMFLRVDLDQRGIDACGSLLCEFRTASSKLKIIADETMETKLDQALDDRRNPVLSASAAAAAAQRRRTMVVADKEHLLWRCKAFDLLPPKYVKKGVIAGGSKDEINRLEAEIRAMEAVLITKRRMLLENSKRDLSRELGKV